MTAPPGPPPADQEPDPPTPGASNNWRTSPSPHPTPLPRRDRGSTRLSGGPERLPVDSAAQPDPTGADHRHLPAGWARPLTPEEAPQ